MKQSSVPRISFFDAFDRPREPARLPLTSDDPLDAGRLARRLDAAAVALDDLPRQAKRLARWQARRDAAWAQQADDAGEAARQGLIKSLASKDDRGGAPSRHPRFSAMRPGRPPGWRRRPDHPVYEILNEVHGLAFWAREQSDTS